MVKKLNDIIENLITRDYEEEWFEFKINWFEPHELGTYISGMSNVAAMVGQEYAYLIWGVENELHKVVGTTFDFHRNVKNEPLEHYLARQVKPDLDFKFHETLFRGKRVVVLMIPAAKDVPTSFDRNRYFRIGSSKVNLIDYPKREAQLFMALHGEIPTIEKVASEYQELTFNKLFAFYGSRGISLNKRTFKKNLNLLTSEGKYNVMAQLLSDNSQIPIRFGLFTGKTKASTMYAVREFGNDCLLYSLDAILRYGEVLNVPQADERGRIVERKEVLLFNQNAYREAVINAFVHNHWLDGPPAFTVFQDRIEILSKGLLPPKQTLDGFFAGESIPVNEKLAKIILQLHISEQTGRGVPAIVDAYGKSIFRFSENNIKVTIPFERLENENYTQDQVKNTQDSTLVSDKKAPVKGKNAPVDAPVKSQNAPVNINNTQDVAKNTQDAAKNTQDAAKNTQDAVKNTQDKIYLSKVDRIKAILDFCTKPRSIVEITNFLHYKERKSVRKILMPLIEQGRIAMTIPEKHSSKNQKYISIR